MAIGLYKKFGTYWMCSSEDMLTDRQTDRQTEMLDTMLHYTTGDCTKRCVKILSTTAQLQEQVVQQIQNKAK